MDKIGKIFYYGPRQPLSEADKIYREWEIERSKAVSPSDLLEIDTIFSRALDK